VVQPASQLDGFELDGFPPRQDGLTTTEVDIGRGQVVKTFVIALQVVVIDELGQTLFELTRQLVVLEQDLVLHRAVVALDLALGHRVIGLAAGVRHAAGQDQGNQEFAADW
jgi:hypothetical protein